MAKATPAATDTAAPKTERMLGFHPDFARKGKIRCSVASRSDPSRDLITALVERPVGRLGLSLRGRAGRIDAFRLVRHVGKLVEKLLLGGFVEATPPANQATVAEQFFRYESHAVLPFLQGPFWEPVG
jgi:hypothetical protein